MTTTPALNAIELAKLVIDTLSDHKALQITDIDVTPLTTVTDRMIICSAISKRHAVALANHVLMQAKTCGTPPLGIEGQNDGEWILIDLQDVIVHIMLPEIREFYSLEKLWRVTENPNSTV